MKREALAPRFNWKQRHRELSFEGVESSSPDPYWQEEACYRFTSAQIDEIEEATNQLHTMCIAAVQHVIDEDLFHRFAIPEQFQKHIVTTWNREDPSVYGRFDFAYDGEGPPKMLEYNADTPTSLYEAAVLQWHAKEHRNWPDQFNMIHEKLVDTWGRINAKFKVPQPLYFASDWDSAEDYITTEYIRDLAEQAGIRTEKICITKVGWNERAGVFRDPRTYPETDIKAMFKLYPWEHMLKEEFGKHTLRDNTGFIEPAWKMLLSNKAILPILWELYPGHPNLLATYDSPDRLGGRSHVKKAKLGREGSSVTIVDPDDGENNAGPYGAEGYVYQEYARLPSFKDGGHTVHPVIGSWVIGGESAGMGIRESTSRITNNRSRFVPHYFT